METSYAVYIVMHRVYAKAGIFMEVMTVTNAPTRQESHLIDVWSLYCRISLHFFLVFWSILHHHQSVPYCLSSISCGTHAVFARPLSLPLSLTHTYTYTNTHTRTHAHTHTCTYCGDCRGKWAVCGGLDSWCWSKNVSLGTRMACWRQEFCR